MEGHVLVSASVTMTTVVNVLPASRAVTARSVSQ